MTGPDIPCVAVAHDDEAEQLREALRAGTLEHYLDAALYDHEYKRRKQDLTFYRALANDVAPADASDLLELGCGSGRLLLPLARDGHRVTGVDLSAAMLARLRERLDRAPEEVRARVTLHRADFRKLALRRRFPLILCPFNAFMHLYTREDVEQFLAAIRRHLRKDGLFVFDVMNPDLRWLSRDADKRWARTKFRHPTTGERMIYTTNLVWDGPLQIAFMRIYYAKEKGRREEVVQLTHRYFFPRELEALLHYNGFRIERHEGDFEGQPLTTDSEQQVLHCRLR
jgi:SAM-dependent methyltransferase